VGCLHTWIAETKGVVRKARENQSMSIVCFPFKEEDVSVVVRNVECAASHPRVAAVLCVGYSQGETWHAIENAKPRIEKATGKDVILLLQKRIGVALRGGKGDGMNTALSYFLEHSEYPRLHFYDADIVSFSEKWISKAELQADLDYDVVRHYFPRSSTDAMITWLVTKLGFAILWPNTVLPSIEQPLGGEFLVTRKAAEVLFADQRVCSQSDWGIDTLYTFVIAQNGLRMAEVYIPEGKVHSLYGGLRDLRTMLVECFSAIQSLKNEVVSGEDFGHCIEFPKAVPELLKQKVGYDIEKSLKLLKSHWTPRQQELLHQHFDSALVKGLMNACDWPCWGFADEEAWAGAYLKFLDNFEKGDTDWEELLFKVWVARVLNHTLRHVIRGYDVALGSLRDLVWDTRQRFGMKLKADALAVHPIVISGHSAAEGLAANGALTKSGRKKAQWLDMDNLCTV
jgi:mannosylglycerate synthase